MIKIAENAAGEDRTFFSYEDMDTKLTVDHSAGEETKGEVFWFWMLSRDLKVAQAVIMPRREIKRLIFHLECELEATEKDDDKG